MRIFHLKNMRKKYVRFFALSAKKHTFFTPKKVKNTHVFCKDKLWSQKTRVFYKN